MLTRIFQYYAALQLPGGGGTRVSVGGQNSGQEMSGGRGLGASQQAQHAQQQAATAVQDQVIMLIQAVWQTLQPVLVELQVGVVAGGGSG